MSTKLIPLSYVEKAFHIMLMSYGRLFENQWGNQDVEDVKAHWLWVLNDENITPEEMTRGVKALRSMQYPPSLPQFVYLCRPALDAKQAYFEALNGLREREKGEKGEWSHPAVFWAAVSMHHDLLNMGEKAVEIRLAKALEKELAKGTWQEIPTPAVAVLEAPKSEMPDGFVDEITKQILSIDNPTGWITRGLEKIKEGMCMSPAVKRMILRGAMNKDMLPDELKGLSIV